MNERIEKEFESFNEKRRLNSEGYPPEQWFKAGWDAALRNQWVSIDEELPDLDGHGYSRPVLVREEHGDLLIATYSGQHEKWNSVGPLSYHRIIVTHWMNIPPMEGGEE